MESDKSGGSREKTLTTSGGYSYRRIDFHLARKQNNKLRTSGDFWIETLNPDSGRKRTASGSGLDGPQGKRVEGSDFVENGLDPELTFGFTIRKIIKIGAGLENLGNTCFLNSVLQCLTYTEPLAAYLQSGKHQNSCRIAGFCALCAIQKHVSCALQSTGRSLVPKDLVSNLRCISRNFRTARQEDAHEYMVNLLESMHKCCLPSGVPTESPVAYEKSLVHKIFGGRLRSQVECLQCSYRSDKFDPFLDLSLEILKADSLPVALRNFTTAELLDGGEKHYQCQRCKEKVKAKKRFTVHQAPYVLTIHLKRFHFHDPGRKVDKKVLFHCSLDMKPFFSGSCEGDLKYSLYGVLVHYGHNTHSGHYVCFVRTSSGMWYFLNDNEVRQVSEKTVLEQKAYMLFYVRDTKHIAPQKSIDVVVNDNVKAMTSSDIALFHFNQISKEPVGSVSIEKKSNATGVSAPVNRKGAINSLTENLHKGALEQNSRLSSLDSSMQKAAAAAAAAALKTSNGAMPTDLGKKYQSSSTMNSGCVGHSSDISTGLTGPKTREGIAVFSSCGSQSSPELAEETCLKINPMVHEALPGQVPCGEAGNRATDEVTNCVVAKDFTDGLLDNCLLKTQSEPSSESNQGLNISRGIAAINLNLDKAGDSDQNIVHETTNTQSVIPNDSLCGKASECAPPKKKFKKKLRKRPVKKLRLTARLFDASLHMMKKKYKNVKHRNLDAPSLITEHKPDDRRFSSELVASAAKGMTSARGLINSIKMEPSLCSKDPGVTRKSSVDATNVGTQQKDTQISSEPSIDKKLQKSGMSTSGANELDGRKINYLDDCKLGRTHAGMLSMLTQGLAETAVARWEGVELPRASIVDAEGPKDFSIGYVADEWDEEYDQGKRKKLRNSKREFGGLNPFQEISSKKAKFRLGKMNWINSRNPPFRI